MHEQDIEELLRRRVQQFPERQPDCPEPEVIACYVEGGLDEAEHARLSEHFSECEACLEVLGLVCRARESEDSEPVPDLALARARRLVEPARSEAWRRLPRWAAAAVVVLAVGALLRPALLEHWREAVPGSDTHQATGEPVRQTRNYQPLSARPRVTSPGEGEVLNRRSGEISWTAVQDSLYYELRIVSDSGDLVWEERVHGTRWRLPETVTLERGAEYYVRVDAFLSGTQSLHSDYFLFRAGGNP